MAEYHGGELIARMLQAEDHVFRRGGACRGFNQPGAIGRIGKGSQAASSSERVWDLMGGASGEVGTTTSLSSIAAGSRFFVVWVFDYRLSVSQLFPHRQSVGLP